MISDAFTPEQDAYDPSIVWVPKHPTLENFKMAYSMLNMPFAFFHTLLYQILSALIEVGVCSIVAYGLARFRFREKKLLEFILMLTILVPMPMIIIPMTVNYSQLDFLGILNLIGGLIGHDIRPNLLNTGFSFWLPSLLGVGLQSGILIYIFRQFFRNIPRELEEAACIDGAGPLRTFLSVVIPSSGVVFLTVSIFSVIWHWNDAYMPTMFLTDDYPLSVAVSMISTELVLENMQSYGVQANGIIMAGCVIFVTPMFVLYLVLQKKFIKSIDRVGIVG
jgi:ABC transporter, permease protein